MVIVKEIVSKLPEREKYNLIDQLRRSCMAIPVLIAEGYAKKHLQRAFSKYLDDANGECNEVIVHLSFCLDIYGDTIGRDLIKKLISNYDKYARQIYKLSNAWRTFKR